MADRSTRSQVARIGAYALHATHDSREITKPARAAFLGRFEREVPAEITDPLERARRAEYLKKAYFAKLALRSAQARRKGATS